MHCTKRTHCEHVNNRDSLCTGNKINSFSKWTKRSALHDVGIEICIYGYCVVTLEVGDGCWNRYRAFMRIDRITCVRLVYNVRETWHGAEDDTHNTHIHSYLYTQLHIVHVYTFHPTEYDCIRDQTTKSQHKTRVDAHNISRGSLVDALDFNTNNPVQREPKNTIPLYVQLCI